MKQKILYSGNACNYNQGLTNIPTISQRLLPRRILPVPPECRWIDHKLQVLRCCEAYTSSKQGAAVHANLEQRACVMHMRPKQARVLPNHLVFLQRSTGALQC